MDAREKNVYADHEPVELFKVLKMGDLVMSGGEGKYVISQGLVRVNGGVETRKARKIRYGDRILFQEVTLVLCPERGGCDP